MEGSSLEDKFICRACLRVVECKTQSFGYVDDATGNLRDMLMCCVPEMDIYVSPNPIICIQCIQTLITVQHFKSRCINTESIIRSYMNKYHLSEQSTINLGAVVHDLIELNNIHKQQEERRRQLIMQQFTVQQKVNLIHPRFPPPLHFSERTTREPPNQPKENQQMPPQSFPKATSLPGLVHQTIQSAPVASCSFSPQTESTLNPVPTANSVANEKPISFLRLVPSTGSVESLGPLPPLCPVNSINSARSYPSGPISSNNDPSGSAPPEGSIAFLDPVPSCGIVLPLKVPQPLSNGFITPSQSLNILQSSTDAKRVLVTDTASKSTDNNSDSIHRGNVMEIVTHMNENGGESDNQTVIEPTSDTPDIPNTIKKITYHPIESKRRLVISLSRYKISVPFNGIKNKLNSFDREMESSNYTENGNDAENVPMEDDMYPVLNEIATDIPEDVAEDTPEDTPEYVSEDGNLNDNQQNTEEQDTSIHKNITKFFNCSCMYLTTSEKLFIEHKKRCQIGERHVLKCPHCPHITNRSYALNKHINTMHTKAIWFICDLCTYRSTDKSCLRRHVRKNHEDPPDDTKKQYFCQLCSLVISTESNYNRHMLRHEDSPAHMGLYSCDFCSYHSKDRSNYRKHIFTHCPVPLNCPNCPYTNVSPYQLRSHIRKYHDGAGIEVADCKSDLPVSELVSDIKEMMRKAEIGIGNECS